MRLFIHALGASAGGGLTYLRNVLPHLATHPDVEVSLLAGDEAAAQIPAAGNVHLVRCDAESRGTLARFLWEQKRVPALIRDARADVLLCAGNFAIWKSPVAQILLSRNSLYTSADFERDLRQRSDYRLLVDTWVKAWAARKSIQRAELTVAPSEAFARDLKAWARRDVVWLYHGFDHDEFFRDPTPLPPLVQAKLHADAGTVRLLFVSHYNYYRNFETLLRGFALLKQRYPHGKIQLVLTCELAPGKNPGSYRTEGVTELLQELSISSDVVQLGAVAYQQLHHVYRCCQIYVTPAYTETFAHPLVEAMACGLPIVASDLEVHREIANGAALFFDRFSPSGLAERVAQLLESPASQSDLRMSGLRHSETFSWSAHVDRLLELAQGLSNKSH